MVGLAGQTGFTVLIKLLPGSPGINVATKLQNVVRGTCGDPQLAPAPGGNPMVAPERHPANGPITLTPFHSRWTALNNRVRPSLSCMFVCAAASKRRYLTASTDKTFRSLMQRRPAVVNSYA